MKEIQRRVLHLLIALDQLAWVILTLGNGNPDETISAAAYRLEAEKKFFGVYARPFIDWMFIPFEREHCRKSYMSEMIKEHLPEIYSGDRM